MRLLFAGVSAFALASVMLTAAPDTVTVDGGRVSGIVTDGVNTYRGIPYAAPPVGELRWKPPAALVPWQGVRDGSKYGAECPQTQYPDGSVYIRPLQPQSEDCLFLNVWTTAKAGDKRPVFVWVHGGALTHGSSISDVRDGSAFAKKNIVVVSLNYRLGALGYMAHPELTAESPMHASGNYGVLDQIAALKWVQKNIAAFGGDPAQVTIGGESAGSWSVSTLVASPLARGLFIRAIGESGARFFGTPHLHDDRPGMTSAENVGLALAKNVGASLPARSAGASRRQASGRPRLPHSGNGGRLGPSRRRAHTLRAEETQQRAGARRIERERNDVAHPGRDAAENDGRLSAAHRGAVPGSGGGVQQRLRREKRG